MHGAARSTAVVAAVACARRACSGGASGFAPALGVSVGAGAAAMSRLGFPVRCSLVRGVADVALGDRPKRESTLADKSWEAPHRTRQRKANKKAPMLSETMRQFVRLVHPDRFATQPELHDLNQNSLKTLNEFLQHIKTKVDDDHPYPAARRQTLVFVLKTQEGLRKLRVDLRTTGGNCQHLVKDTLGDMFARCGFPSDFEWDNDYWKENNTHLYEDA